MSFVVSPRHGPKHFDDATQQSDMAERAEREAEIAQRVKRELAKIRSLAEAQGREAGYAEGFATGKADAETAMQSAAAALSDAAAQLTSPLAVKQADLAALVTKLSLNLAAHIIGCEISASATPITSLANSLLAQAAAERMPRSRITLRLNPADHAILAHLPLPAETSLTPDPAITEGGACLEITSAEATRPTSIWDATIETRLASLV